VVVKTPWLAQAGKANPVKTAVIIKVTYDFFTVLLFS
jgi:hypothetical protein